MREKSLNLREYFMDFTIRKINGQPKRCFFYGCAKVAEKEIRAGGTLYAICDDCLKNLTATLKTKNTTNTRKCENAEN